MSPLSDMRQIRDDFGRPLVMAMAVTAGALCMLAGAFVWSWANPPLPKVLGPYPEQHVTLTREVLGIDGAVYDVPLLHYPDQSVVPVMGEKCAKVPTEVKGAVGWKPVVPNDTTIVVSTGVGSRQAGCSSFQFDNRVPPEVAQYLSALNADGIDVSLWRITGVETPLSPVGLDQAWQTETFAISWGSNAAEE